MILLFVEQFFRESNGILTSAVCNTAAHKIEGKNTEVLPLKPMPPQRLAKIQLPDYSQGAVTAHILS